MLDRLSFKLVNSIIALIFFGLKASAQEPSFEIIGGNGKVYVSAFQMSDDLKTVGLAYRQLYHEIGREAQKSLFIQGLSLHARIIVPVNMRTSNGWDPGYEELYWNFDRVDEMNFSRLAVSLERRIPLSDRDAAYLARERNRIDAEWNVAGAALTSDILKRAVGDNFALRDTLLRRFSLKHGRTSWSIPIFSTEVFGVFNQLNFLDAIESVIGRLNADRFAVVAQWFPDVSPAVRVSLQKELYWRLWSMMNSFELLSQLFVCSPNTYIKDSRHPSLVYNESGRVANEARRLFYGPNAPDWSSILDNPRPIMRATTESGPLEGLKKLCSKILSHLSVTRPQTRVRK